MKDLYFTIKYYSIRRDFKYYTFKRIKSIRNLNNTINILSFNIQNRLLRLLFFYYYITSIGL